MDSLTSPVTPEGQGSEAQGRMAGEVKPVNQKLLTSEFHPRLIFQSFRLHRGACEIGE